MGGTRSRTQVDERQELLQNCHDAQVLVSEAVDVTIPTARERQGARSLLNDYGRDFDLIPRDRKLNMRVQLRLLNFRYRSPRASDAGHALH